MAEVEVDNSWIKPGAEVVVFSTGGRANPRKAIVKSVAAKSFVVEGLTERIKLDRLESKAIGETWSTWSYRVVRPESEEASRLFARERVGRLSSRAHTAAKDWMVGGGSADLAKDRRGDRRLPGLPVCSRRHGRRRRWLR